MTTAFETTSSPPIPRPASRPWRALALSFGAWTLHLVLSTHILYVYLPGSGGRHFTWLGLFLYGVPMALGWALLTPLIVAGGRRWRVVGPGWGRALTLHFAAAMVMHLLTVLLEYGPWPWSRERMSVAAMILNGIFYDAIRYGMIVAVVHVLDFHRMARQREREALLLRSELVEARLQVMKMQLQPHFLFNTLHAISELVYRDPRVADRAIARLADLLRMALAGADRHEIPLAEELDFVRAYLDIERMRSGDRLHVAIDADPATLALGVPGLVLQPLAENAIRHGLRGRESGAVAIAARREGERLVVTVEDDGRGLPPGSVANGIGLRTTRVRLRGLYGDDHRLDLSDRPGGGVIARLDLPARAVEESDPAVAVLEGLGG